MTTIPMGIVFQTLNLTDFSAPIFSAPIFSVFFRHGANTVILVRPIASLSHLCVQQVGRDAMHRQRQHRPVHPSVTVNFDP